jgi:hypothetical protein
MMTILAITTMEVIPMQIHISLYIHFSRNKKKLNPSIRITSDLLHLIKNCNYKLN